MKIKIAGHCTLCDKEVFEFREKYTSGPLEGHPKKIGRHTEDATKVEYFLADGTRCTMTCCRNCLDAMINPENYQMIWDKVLNTFVFEDRDDVREQKKCPIRTPEQRKAVDEFILSQVNNFILYAVETAPYG